MGAGIARVALPACALGLAVGVYAQSAVAYKARLSPVPMDLAMAANIAGSGSVTATLTGTKLSVAGTFEGLKSPATVVQIRKGRPGVRGAAILDLKATGGTSGTVAGSLDLTSQQVADLQMGWLYVQLHSERAPDGNLWGWLTPQENKR